MLRLDPPLQVPDEDTAIVAGGEDDPGVEGMGLQDKHLRLVALQHKTTTGGAQSTAQLLCDIQSDHHEISRQGLRIQFHNTNKSSSS